MIWWKETESFLESRTLPFLIVWWQVWFLNHLSLLKSSEESMIHLFLCQFWSHSCWHLKVEFLVLESRGSQLCQRPHRYWVNLHIPLGSLPETFWGNGGVEPRDLHFYQVFLTQPICKSHSEKHCSKALGQRHKLHRRSFLVHLTLHHIPEPSTRLGVDRHPSNPCHLTTSDQRNEFSLTVKNDTMYLLK